MHTYCTPAQVPDFAGFRRWGFWNGYPILIRGGPFGLRGWGGLPHTPTVPGEEGWTGFETKGRGGWPGTPPFFSCRTLWF